MGFRIGSKMNLKKPCFLTARNLRPAPFFKKTMTFAVCAAMLAIAATAFEKTVFPDSPQPAACALLQENHDIRRVRRHAGHRRNRICRRTGRTGKAPETLGLYVHEPQRG
jgi:hypothetical protein